MACNRSFTPRGSAVRARQRPPAFPNAASAGKPASTFGRLLAVLSDPRLLEPPDQPRRDRQPGRRGDDDLALARAEREDVELGLLAADQAAEYEALAGARDEDVAVHRIA